MGWDNWRETDVDGYVRVTDPCGHADSHEHYDVEVGDSGYGPYWEQGIRCPVCRRKWADPEVARRQHQEWLDKQASEWVAVCGTSEEQIQTLSGHWGDPPHDLQDDYEHILDSWMGVYQHPYPESATAGDIVENLLWNEDCMMADRERIAWPPLEETFYVFVNDCGPCDVTTEIDGRSQRWTDEWNLLNNWPGVRHPMHPAAKAVWDKLKVPYAEAARRISDPRPRPYGVGSDLKPAAAAP